MTQKLVGRGNLVVHADMSPARVARPVTRRRTLSREGSDGRSLLACDLARIETDLSVRIDDQVIGNIGTHDGPQLLDHLDRGDAGAIRQVNRAAVDFCPHLVVSEHGAADPARKLFGVAGAQCRLRCVAIDHEFVDEAPLLVGECHGPFSNWSRHVFGAETGEPRSIRLSPSADARLVHERREANRKKEKRSVANRRWAEVTPVRLVGPTLWRRQASLRALYGARSDGSGHCESVDRAHQLSRATHEKTRRGAGQGSAARCKSTSVALR